MKKLKILFTSIFTITCVTAFSQMSSNECINHVHVGYGSSSLKSKGYHSEDMKSKTAGNFCMGQTRYSDQIIGTDTRYGLTYDFINITHAQFDYMQSTNGQPDNSEIDNTCVGVSVGGALRFLLNGVLNLTMHAKYQPGYSIMKLQSINGASNNKFKGMSNGLSLSCDISFMKCGLGLEYNFNSANYRMGRYDSAINDYYTNLGQRFGLDKGNINTHSYKVYLAFKF